MLFKNILSYDKNYLDEEILFNLQKNQLMLYIIDLSNWSNFHNFLKKDEFYSENSHFVISLIQNYYWYILQFLKSLINSQNNKNAS